MKRSLTLLGVALLCLSFNSFSQDYQPPTGYTLQAKDDYAKYEKEIILAAKWLQATPFNEEKGKRIQVHAFVMDWVNGSPTVTVEIVPILMDFEKKNNGMLMLYMAGCARHALETNLSATKKAQCLAALQGMIEMYKTGKGINKDKKMEKLITAANEGSLDKWYNENIKTGR